MKVYHLEIKIAKIRLICHFLYFPSKIVTVIFETYTTFLIQFGKQECIYVFQELINEQFVSKEQLYFLSFGSKPEVLWEASHDVNCRM